jgi:hypothetical protein
MANLILTNNSSQVECTISQSYCRLTGSYAGPLNASAQSNSGFLIQNGNKQSGLFVGNTCTTFYNNCLSFDPANTDVNLNIPNTRSFIITGNNSLLTFNADGTLAVGAAIDTNYKGMQVVNTSPIFLLKDTDALNHSGNQALSFFDSTGAFSASFCNEPSSSINTGSATTDNATAIVYNKYFRLRNNPSNGSVNTLIACGNNLTLFSGDCLNRSFNLAIGGTSYFACDLFSSGTINTSGLCVLSNNSFLRGSGDAVAFNICNNRSNSSGSINFYNPSGGLHSLILSTQNSGLGCSEIDFYVTPTGAYNSTNRNQLALEIKGDTSARFYGNICAQTGIYAFQIRSNGIENSGCRTYLAAGGDGFHYFGSDVNNCAYGISIDSSRRILNHRWITSGRSSMCLDFNQNLIVTGCLLSNGINSTSALLVNNANATDSCIRSRCITFCANGANQNIINCGNFINYGSAAIFSGICSTGNQLNNISGCLCLQNNLYVNSICMTAGNGICGPSGCFTTCIQSQVVCSNSCVRADSICSTGIVMNCFNSSISTNGCVIAQNTAKSWGIFGVNGSVGSFTNGFNVSSINIYQNATPLVYAYGLCFNNPIKYPFTANFNVYPSGNPLITGHAGNLQFGQQLGFSGNTNTAVLIGANSSTSSPYFIEFYALSGKCSTTSTLAPYAIGSTYSEIYFNFGNSKGPTTPYSELTRTSAVGIVHFSIFGS